MQQVLRLSDLEAARGPCAVDCEGAGDGVRSHGVGCLTGRTSPNKPHTIATHSVNGAVLFQHPSPVYARVVFGVLSVTALIGLLLVDNLVLAAVCGWGELGVALCQAGVLFVGATVAHVAELCAARPPYDPPPPTPPTFTTAKPLLNHG